MTTKHTPGPFIAWDDGRTIGIERGGEPFAIAEIVDHGDMASDEQIRADQELFTRAASSFPDMLEALEDALPLVEELITDETDARNYTLDRIRAALAKARGEVV